MVGSGGGLKSMGNRTVVRMRHFEFPSRFVTVQKWPFGDWPMRLPDYSAWCVSRYTLATQNCVENQVPTSTDARRRIIDLIDLNPLSRVGSSGLTDTILYVSWGDHKLLVLLAPQPNVDFAHTSRRQRHSCRAMTTTQPQRIAESILASTPR